MQIFLSDEPDLTELSIIIEHILSELRKDNINLDDVVIIAEGGEILMKIKKVRKASWPSVFHVQSFMGNEAPVIIWVTGSVYVDRQVDILLMNQSVQ